MLAFESEGLALPPSVRLVIIGGEKALAERVAQWHAHTAQTARPARLINTYGADRGYSSRDTLRVTSRSQS